MRSQEKWGYGFIAVALVLVAIVILEPDIFPLLIYSAILGILGIALIIFKNRESKMEKV